MWLYAYLLMHLYIQACVHHLDGYIWMNECVVLYKLDSNVLFIFMVSHKQVLSVRISLIYALCVQKSDTKFKK